MDEKHNLNTGYVISKFLFLVRVSSFASVFVYGLIMSETDYFGRNAYSFSIYLAMNVVIIILNIFIVLWAKYSNSMIVKFLIILLQSSFIVVFDLLYTQLWRMGLVYYLTVFSSIVLYYLFMIMTKPQENKQLLGNNKKLQFILSSVIFQKRIKHFPWKQVDNNRRGVK